MINRKYGKLILDKRVGMRKASSGRPQQIDEEDEQFILQCIEEKATANGRRHDAVLYTGHRVKKKDFLKLANYSIISRGLLNQQLQFSTAEDQQTRGAYRLRNI